MKKRIIVISLLCILFFGSLLSILSMVAKEDNSEEQTPIKETEFFLDSPLFTHLDDKTPYAQDEVDLSGFTKKLEKDGSNLVLYSNKSTGAIRIFNKETNFYWCSDIYDINSLDSEGNPKYAGLTKKQAREMSSAFTILYYNNDLANKSSVYSSDNKAITLTEKVNDSKDILTVNVSFVNKDTSGNITCSAKFSYEIKLLESSIDVIIHYDSLEEENMKILSITLFPFLGSAYGDSIPGYIFYPSGSGALIRYEKTYPITSTYEATFFGSDANMANNEEADILSMPIYGVVHGVDQNAMFVEINGGAAFTRLSFAPANKNSGFNNIYPTFRWRENYYIKIPGSDQIEMIPDDIYKQDISIRYNFLSNSDANYIGMAKIYQNHLLENGDLSLMPRDDKNDISLEIEAFGRDYERGLIFKRYKNMTTISDILNINAYIEDAGISNTFYVLRAFNRGGYSDQSVSNYKVDRSLGRLSKLDDLESYIYYNPIESYNTKKSFPANTLINLLNEKSYIFVGKDKYKFYANVKAVEKYTTKAIKYYEDYECGIALDGIGYRLYGDKNNKLLRMDTMDIYSNLLGDSKIPLYKPNSYLLKNTSKYLNIPMYGDRYRFITDSVPFIQILLRGYVEYYSPYLNFSSNIDLDILRCIELGVNPAFLITSEPSYLLSGTLSSNYYATYFETTKAFIKSYYDYINQALKEVKNEQIVNREIVKEGISVVTYSNGKKIIVNYTNETYSYQGTSVPSLGYKVV